MFSCPKCGERMYSSSRNPEGWGVCPKCQYCCFNITAKLEERNSSVRELIQRVRKGEIQTDDKCKELLKNISVAEYCTDQVGNLNGWCISQYNKLCSKLDRDDTPQYRTPPILSIDRVYLNKIKDSIIRLSGRWMNYGDKLGIDLPLYQEQSQMVGHITLFKSPEKGDKSFRWMTTMHKFYQDTYRAFLSYRPGPLPDHSEVILVDDIGLYMKLLHWYDTGLGESDVFYSPIAPVLILDSNVDALKYLTRYAWEPDRVTLLTTNQKLRSRMWRIMNRSKHFLALEYRILKDPDTTLEQIKACTHRSQFEKIIETQTNKWYILDLYQTETSH